MDNCEAVYGFAAWLAALQKEVSFVGPLSPELAENLAGEYLLEARLGIMPDPDTKPR